MTGLEIEEQKAIPTGSKEKTKTKTKTIIEVANALTTLGDSDSKGSTPSSLCLTLKKETIVAASMMSETSFASSEKSDDKPSKRYIPEHKKSDAALTFPEKLMTMMEYAEIESKDDRDSYCIAWLTEGKSFIIRNPDEFTRNILPKFFKATKFSSYTRKLYRWGFRQLNRGIGLDDPIIFGNDLFQRDHRELMVKMRSVTAASTRKMHHTEPNDPSFMEGSLKRGFNTFSFDQEQRKRMLLDRLIQEKVALGSALAESDFNMMGVAPPMRNNLNFASAIRAAHGMNGAMNPSLSSSLGYPSMPPKHLGRLGMPSMNGNFNLYQAVSNHAAQRVPVTNSSSDIVHAAYHALRYPS